MNIGKLLNSDLAQRLLTIAQLVPQTSAAATLIEETLQLTKGGVTPAHGVEPSVGGGTVDAQTQALTAAMAVVQSLVAPKTVVPAQVGPGYLSQHFSEAEMIVSQTAARDHLDNTPSADVLSNLTATCEQMEVIRHLLGDRPILVSSAYRSAAVNAAVGGSSTSGHVEGYACDFTCPGFGTPLAIAEFLVGKVKFDQLIHEYDSWVHVSFDPQMREQTLTITSAGGTQQGLN